MHRRELFGLVATRGTRVDHLLVRLPRGPLLRGHELGWSLGPEYPQRRTGCRLVPADGAHAWLHQGDDQPTPMVRRLGGMLSTTTIESTFGW